MAYQALYRKYRPETFMDVCGQEHVTETLKNGIKEGKIVHAYLFTGTRGTGKTTCAKILAKAVNCLNPQDGNPCGECEVCRAVKEGSVTDIVEIDAASNNGVESIRELREQVAFPPAFAKYRVYIIDEVHMLSIGAFNALLKTLEEPPEHVIFILATTEVHKLPATILSRCQRFDFRRIDSLVIKDRIKTVASSEGFNITDDAANLIAAVADGGMRDALSILDLCTAASSEITEETVQSVCSMAGDNYLLELADCIADRETEKSLCLINELHMGSVDMQRLLNELLSHFRDLLIIKTVGGKNAPVVCSAARLKALENQVKKFELGEIISIIDIIQKAVASAAAGNGKIIAEMTAVRLCNPQIRQDINSLEQRIAALESGKITVKAEPVKQEETPDISEETFEESEEITTEDTAPTPETEETKETSGEPTKLNEWQDIIFVLQKTCPALAGVLSDSAAYISGNRILIDTKSEQFRSLYSSENPMYRNSIKEAALQILGKPYSLGPYKKSEPTSDPLAAFAEKLKTFEN